MTPYKYVDIPGFELITPKLESFIRDIGLLDKGTFFNPVGAARVYDAIPELKGVMSMLSIDDFVSMAVIRVLPSSVAPNFPHADIMPDPDLRIGLNWPVLNCEETYTTFYEKKPGAQPDRVTLPNGLPYERYGYDMVNETHRIKINRPVAIRVDVLHAVVNDTKDLRVTVSFRFKTNPWHLFEET